MSSMMADDKGVFLADRFCRICGGENQLCISVFSEAGKKQGLQKKIRFLLAIIIEEQDCHPKQICIPCLNKLESAWEFIRLGKEGQIIIGKKFKSATPTEVKEESSFSSIEERIQVLDENESIPLNNTTLITLLPTTEEPLQQETCGPAQRTMVNPLVLSPAPAPGFPTYPTAPVNAILPAYNTVYPQTLIQVYPEGEMEVHQPEPPQEHQPAPPQVQCRTLVPALRRSVPLPKPMPLRTKNISSHARRRALGNRIVRNLQSKRLNQVCRYCDKLFPDDIIDHHVNLHLRQSFITCIECNKNFRSEEAMSRHRCSSSDVVRVESNSDPINLDSDEENPTYA